MDNRKTRKIFIEISLIGVFLVLGILFLNVVSAATPVGFSNVDVVSNTTKAAPGATMVNISGGYLAKLNVTANLQNLKWKAFVGWVTGKFSLDDSGGSTIYDWTFTVANGRIYATRASSAISWDDIACADTDALETENTAMDQSNPNDNITATFDDVAHEAFSVAGVSFAQDACNYTVNTYVENVTQSGTDFFEEVALTDTTNIVYATILESGETGYDGSDYDFQMLVPENGDPGFDGATAYYMYIEIN